MASSFTLAQQKLREGMGLATRSEDVDLIAARLKLEELDREARLLKAVLKSACDAATVQLGAARRQMTSVLGALAGKTVRGTDAEFVLKLGQVHDYLDVTQPSKLVDAFEKVVLAPMDEWLAELAGARGDVKEANEKRVVFDHYREKMAALQEDRKKQQLAGKIVPQRENDKLKRNEEKFAKASDEWHGFRDRCVGRLLHCFESAATRLLGVLHKLMQFETALFKDGYTAVKTFEPVGALLSSRVRDRVSAEGAGGSMERCIRLARERREAGKPIVYDGYLPARDDDEGGGGEAAAARAAPAAPSPFDTGVAATSMIGSSDLGALSAAAPPPTAAAPAASARAAAGGSGGSKPASSSSSAAAATPTSSSLSSSDAAPHAATGGLSAKIKGLFGAPSSKAVGSGGSEAGGGGARQAGGRLAASAGEADDEAPAPARQQQPAPVAAAAPLSTFDASPPSAAAMPPSAHLAPAGAAPAATAGAPAAASAISWDAFDAAPPAAAALVRSSPAPAVAAGGSSSGSSSRGGSSAQFDPFGAPASSSSSSGGGLTSSLFAPAPAAPAAAATGAGSAAVPVLRRPGGGGAAAARLRTGSASAGGGVPVDPFGGPATAAPAPAGVPRQPQPAALAGNPFGSSSSSSSSSLSSSSSGGGLHASSGGGWDDFGGGGAGVAALPPAAPVTTTGGRSSSNNPFGDAFAPQPPAAAAPAVAKAATWDDFGAAPAAAPPAPASAAVDPNDPFAGL